MINPRLDLLADYPFQRLTELLGGPASADSIVMSIGEPQHRPPPMVARILAETAELWGKYPPAAGTDDFCAAVQSWLTRRFALPAGMLDPARMILPVAGTREALYLIAQTVCPPAGDGRPPVVLLPNPFYQVYLGAAVMAGAEPVFVPGAEQSGGLPDYAALPSAILERTALAYLCSPANPQGRVASLGHLQRQIAAARRFGFTLAVDECYSEIWDEAPPAGALEACARMGDDWDATARMGGDWDATARMGGGTDNVLVFHSLSKRSSVPGLRSGFVAGDPDLIKAFTRVRSYGGAATPLPVLAAAAALWRDEAHVLESAALYRAKIDLAQRVFGNRFGFARPEGGFFLWLEVGDGEKAALDLWKRAGIRVLPGAYLARPGDDGINPGRSFIRVALVHDLATTERALARMAEIL